MECLKHKLFLGKQPINFGWDKLLIEYEFCGECGYIKLLLSYESEHERMKNET